MLIVANWKAYVDTPAKAKALAACGKRLVARAKHTIVLAPSFPYLGLIIGGRKGKLAYGAQDVSLSTGGATTGEVTAATLAKLGVTYVIIGHSERRALGETDEIVREKIQRSLANGLTPILCIGEGERDMDARYLAFIRGQLNAIFAPLSPRERAKIVVAYEPVWAIGKSSAEAITAADLAEMVLYVRKIVASYSSARGTQKTRILYGGSVEPSNIRDLAFGSGADGFLIGHASTDVPTFTALVKQLS